MSVQPTPTTSSAPGLAARVPPPIPVSAAGLSAASMEEVTEKRLDDIEMLGEEEAAGYNRPGHSEVSAGMRYLHSSRTIHQLVNDRNRAVGIYLGVASLLWTASSALLNAKPNPHLIVPIETIQRWCLPVTFGILTILAVFVGFLLIRTRIGLIYEVAKMNVLLGLPIGRVKRVNPLSIFFIMHSLVSLAGGCSGIMFAYHLFVLADAGPASRPWLLSILIGFAITLLLMLLYVGTVVSTTSDKRLEGGAGG